MYHGSAEGVITSMHIVMYQVSVKGVITSIIIDTMQQQQDMHKITRQEGHMVYTANDGNTGTAARSRDRRVIWSTQPMMETLGQQQDHETGGSWSTQSTMETLGQQKDHETGGSRSTQPMMETLGQQQDHETGGSYGLHSQ